MLKISNLCFSYEGKKILQNLSLTLKKGESAALIGASGSGKSTLFKVLTGLLVPQSGSIEIEGHASADKQDLIAYMMQEDLLLPWRSVIRNMTLSAELGATSTPLQELKDEAYILLDSLGLAGCADLFPEELSGGMRQRVSLARALILNRPLLLLDEPFGSLDVVLREQIYAFLRRIQRKAQTAILMVTHDFRDALALADHVFLLRQGRIAHEWSILEEEREDPESSGRLLHEIRQALHQAENQAHHELFAQDLLFPEKNS